MVKKVTRYEDKHGNVWETKAEAEFEEAVQYVYDAIESWADDDDLIRKILKNHVLVERA